MNLITLNNVSASYDKKNVLTDINITIDEGDFLTIIGENGSGKSTLIKTLLGLIKPNKGKVLYNNLNKFEIGYLPQSTLIQNDFPASVYEVVLSGCLNSRGLKPFYSKKEKLLALNNIQELGIEKIKNKSYKELSGGQMQRVLLARALCATKKILVLDEPVSGLDPLVTKELYSIISKLNKEKKITIIMISHDLDNAFTHSNKILQLNNKIVFFGTTDEYMRSEECDCFMEGSDDKHN